jgi:hydroxyethylthiazole kinase
MSAGGRGVDTTDTAASAVPAAQALARQTNAVVVVTGEVDYITDGQRTRTVTGGDPLMTRGGNRMRAFCRCGGELLAAGRPAG